MLISTKGRYALRAMIDIAEHNPDEYIPLKGIAERQGISEKYLEGILPSLTKAGFLEALRGKGGGYRLARTPDSYTVASILRAAGENFAPVECLNTTPNTCSRSEDCRTLSMWEDLQNLIDDFFEGVTLADLCESDGAQINYII